MSIFEPVKKAVSNTVDSALNTGFQVLRAPGGAAQGTIKAAAAPLIAVEQMDNMKPKELDKEGYKADVAKIRASGKPYTQADLINAKAAGEITPEQYENTMNSWRAGGNPVDQVRENNTVDREVKTPIKDAVSKVNSDIQNVTDTFIPVPESAAAQWVATGADAIGEAVPTLAVAFMTGGSNILGGSPISHVVGASNAFSTEMVEGSGELERAALSGAVEWGAEKIGGKILNRAAGNISNETLSWGADAVSEGLEEVIGGVAFSALTGDSYGLGQAVQDFALGTTVGGVIGATAKGINSAKAKMTEKQVGKEVNERVNKVAKADVADVQTLLAHADDSGASAVVAQDSLDAIKRQTANPVNTTQMTSQIPADIAQKYHLVPAGDNPNSKPLAIKTQSYEGIVEPLVSEMSAREVSIEGRASINPEDVAVSNPRALYKYADDIYLRPGTDVSDANMFTYRGQANQFYRTSQDAGSIPASSDGTSFEGSGVYSAPDPYTTDLYGPSGKLPDNPLTNRGIKQKAIEVDYPVGVILQQPAGLQENISPVTRTDAPDDVVNAGTRRVRYDDKGRGFTTEIINNPSDISAAGLIFGRTGVAESTPIKYATENPSHSVNESSQAESNNSIKTPDSNEGRNLSGEIEQEAVGYTVPDLINTKVLSSNVNAVDDNERESDRVEKESAVESTESNATINAESVSGRYERNSDPTAESKSMESENAESVKEDKSSKNQTSDIKSSDEYATRESPQETTSSTTYATAPRNAESQQNKSNAMPESDTSYASNNMEAQETPAEIAERIWTPGKVMERQYKAKRKKDRGQMEKDYTTYRGQGSAGRIYETTGYDSTFSGLSSF